VQPKEASLRPPNKTNDPVAAAADVKIACRRNTLRERRPMHTLIADRRHAAIAHRHMMAAPCQGFGERRKCRFRSTERALLGATAVKGNSVIGHHDLSHCLRLPGDRAEP